MASSTQHYALAFHSSPVGDTSQDGRAGRPSTDRTSLFGRQSHSRGRHGRSTSESDSEMLAAATLLTRYTSATGSGSKSGIGGPVKTEAQLWHDQHQHTFDKGKDVISSLTNNLRRWSTLEGDPQVQELEQYRKHALIDPDPLDPMPTFLHQMAKNFNDRVIQACPKPTLRLLLTYMLDSLYKEQAEAFNSGKGIRPSSPPEEPYPAPGVHKSAKPMPVLVIAWVYNRIDFILHVMDGWNDGFAFLLHEKDQDGRNLIHHIFASQDPVNRRALQSHDGDGVLPRASALRVMEGLVAQARPITLAAKDAQGNTPIHLAMEGAACIGQPQPYVSIVIDMLEKADSLMNRGGDTNDAGQSPIQYCHSTWPLALKKWKEASLDEVRSLQHQLENEPTSPPSATSTQTVHDPRPGFQSHGPTSLLYTPHEHNADEASSAPSPARNGKAEKLDSREEDDRREKVDHAQMMGPGKDATDTKPAQIGVRRQCTMSMSGQEGPSSASSEECPGTPGLKLSSQALALAEQPRQLETGQQFGLHGAKDQLLMHMTTHYIRRRPDRLAVPLLYGPSTAGKNLYFDASNVEGPDQITKLLERVHELSGGFSESLSYVFIPSLGKPAVSADSGDSLGRPTKSKLVHEPNQGLRRVNGLAKPEREENPTPGRDFLIGVFRRLHAYGVRFIVRLQVEDFESPGHSDAAIETAIRGETSSAQRTAQIEDLESKLRNPNPYRASPGDGAHGRAADDESDEAEHPSIDIAEWDWARPDLSPDVLLFAAPTAEKVTLYWSGNESVLLAWESEQHGVLQLPHLRKLKVVAAPGLESRHRMAQRLDLFEKRLQKYRMTEIQRETAARVTKNWVDLSADQVVLRRTWNRRQERRNKDEPTTLERPDGLDPAHIRSRASVWEETYLKLLKTLELKIERDIRMPGLRLPASLSGHDAADFPAGRSAADQHKWILCMESFRDAIAEIYHELAEMKRASAAARTSTYPPPSAGADDRAGAKVALIDDGADPLQLDTGWVKPIVIGRSFASPENDGRERPWYHSDGGHGTTMAQMILRINPWTQLSVLRLDTETGPDGGRVIYAASAAEAIDCAVAEGVDVISMSWTVLNKAGSTPAANPSQSCHSQSTGETSIELLEKAIDRAHAKGVLMFCSASDNIERGARDALPYQRAPGHIFRIGAALHFGQPHPQTEGHDSISYFFPGSQVAAAPGSGPSRCHDGSSVATALASGLASLLISCAILLRDWYGVKKGTRSENHQTFRRVARLLRRRPFMQLALDSIDSPEANTDKRYLPVWSIFAATESRMQNARVEEKVNQLKIMMGLLTAKFGHYKSQSSHM